MIFTVKNNTKESKEEFKVSGEEVLVKVKHLIKEGNARRIIIKNEEGEEVMEIPLTIGAVGALLAPALAAIGAVAALLTKCTIVVIKKEKS
ncbi:MAG TPA: DUF4342 domain-containing protein [Candidatus Paceibacterota bacterium]|nr:DUF4342 domain-containing protein [Candidatus Paceibacterota bacterium]